MHLGIDLGTTYSLVSYLNAQGIPTLIPDQNNAREFRTPSIIHFSEEGCYVGSIVEDLLLDDPELLAHRFIKLEMGAETAVFKDAKGNDWRPEAISAIYLKKLLQDVEAQVGEDIESVVIAVPANFNDAQRRGTKIAARLAGLPTPTLIEEPIAAATFYGASQQVEETLFIYDLGGGTFDATVLQSSPDGLYALATQGRNDIGGKTINERLIAFLSKDFQSRTGLSVDSDQANATRLMQFAEDAKLKLSEPGVGQVRETLFLSGTAFEIILTRSQFEQIIEPLIDESILVCENCLKDAGMDWSMIDRLILAGGSSMMPMVLDKLRNRSGLPGSRIATKQPHQSIAYGAALVAAQLAGKSANSPKLHRQIASNDLGLRVWNKALNAPDVEVLIKRNTPLPTEYTRTFYTTREDQTRLVIELVQKSAESIDEVQSLGHFAFGPLANPRKNLPVEITIKADMEGLLHITAKEPSSGQVINQTMGNDGESYAPWLHEQKTLVSNTPVNY